MKMKRIENDSLAGGTEQVGDYVFYDSKLAVRPAELQDLYRFTH